MSSRLLDIDGRRVVVVNPDKVLWSAEHITKSDLVDYYLDLAEYVMPFLVHRPLSLLRWSEDAAAESIFQKTAPPGLPTWLPTRRVRSEHAALGYAEHVIGSDRAALVYLVNLGYVSFHPWSCSVDALDRPDLLILDVDPTEIAFREVRNAALLVRDLFGQYRIRAWVKTSGGRGLHVIVPLQPVHSFAQVLTAAETITRLARHREPTLFTNDMRRARRRGKILIDVHRNHRGATIISPYCVREQSPPTISTPLEWSELEHAMYPEDFQLGTIRQRLRSRGDVFRSFFAHRQSLAPLLEGGRARRARPIA